MSHFLKRLSVFSLSVFLFLGIVLGSQPVSALTAQELAKKYTDPSIDAQAAADFYCQDPAHLPGTGSSVIIPVGGAKINGDGWVYVTLRSLGCGSNGERHVTFYGFNRVNGQMAIDLSPGNAVNVTGKTVTAADGALTGDDLWMVDNGVNQTDGSSGYDLKIRLNGSLFPESKVYPNAITGRGMAWFISPTCPTPLAFDNINQTPGTGTCTLTGGQKTNTATILYGVTVDRYSPTGEVTVSEPIDPNTLPGGPAANAENSCSKVSGWVGDPDKPDSKLTVNVFVNDAVDGQPQKLRKIYTTTADGVRNDSHTGYGFTVPQNVLDQEVGVAKPTVKLYFKAVGFLLDGTTAGGEDGLDFGETTINACPAPASTNNTNNTNYGDVILSPKTGALLGATVMLVAVGVGLVWLFLKEKKARSRVKSSPK